MIPRNNDRIVRKITMFVQLALAALAHRQAIVAAQKVTWTNVKTKTSGLQSAYFTVDFSGQTWEGWGVALAWWAYMFGDDATDRATLKKKNWESDHNEALLAGIFYNPRQQENGTWDKWVDIGKTAGGKDMIRVPKLGFNIVRYNVGGSCGQQYKRSGSVSYNAEVLDYNGRPVDAACTYPTAGGESKFQVGYTQPFKRMQTPKRTPTEWDWSKDNAQTQVLFRAKHLGADIFELFANAAPWWMNHDDRVLTKDEPPANQNDFSFLFKQAEQRDKANFYNNFAKYLLDVYHHFGGSKSEERIVFNSISPINEPSELRGEFFAVPRCYWRENGNNGQEGACYLPEEKRKIIHAMSGKIALAKNDITLSVADENVMSLGTAFIQDLLQYDQVALKKIDRVGVHGYDTCKSGREGLRSAWEAAKRIGGLENARLWNSETGDGDDWCDEFNLKQGVSHGLETVRNLMLDFLELKEHMTAYNYWQVMDEADGWGMAKMDPNHLPLPSILQANWKWFTMAQFSRHIRPGMRILATHALPETPTPGQDAETFVLIAGDLDGKSDLNTLKKLVIVVLNANAISQKPMSFDLTEVLPVGVLVWTRREWVTSAHVGHEMRYEEVGEESKFSGTTLQVDQRAWSVTTVQLDRAAVIPEHFV